MPDKQAYLTSAREAINAVQSAMEEAKVLLPDSIVRQHFIVEHHSPAAWRSCESWYIGRADFDPTIAGILTHMVLLSEALACLAAVTMLGPDTARPPDLRLAKVRRGTL